MFSSQKTVVDLGMPARPGHDTALSIIPAKSGLTRVKEYGLAVGVTLLALLARFLLDPYLGDRLPYETFFVAVGVTAWYGGLGASLTAVLLGAVLSNWFFTAPIKMCHPETIVIGISVNAAGENLEAMKRAGAAELMTKEAAVEQLYDVIQTAVQKR